MTRLAMGLFGLLATATAAAAETLIEAGEWKVTSSAVINGATSPPQSKSRCVTPEQADNVAGTFGPVSNFDSPRHYTAIIASKGRMAGALISDVRTDIEAERVGDCTQ